MIVTVVVTLAIVAAFAALYAGVWPRPLISRARNVHDPAWAPTGVTVKFAGHNQAQGERGLRASLDRAAARRRAADVTIVRPARERVTPIRSGGRP